MQLNNYTPLQNSNILYDVAWADCLRRTNKFARDFLIAEQRPDKGINDLSSLVNDFYQNMNEKFETHFVYKNISAELLVTLSDNMERLLNEQIYQVIIDRIINEDEEQIMALQKRIRSLNWITVEHLDIYIDFQHPSVHDLLDKAICQMIEMNSRTSSIDKLECIVQCSKSIFELLQVSPKSGHTVPVSADQFLPVLVFVVIQANPPMLPADMKFLTHFSNPQRLMNGETGYYFTNLCCALEFIKKASGASLNISEADFAKYVSGEAYPETESQLNTYLCDGLRTMCSNSAAMKQLRRRHEARQVEVDALIKDIDADLEARRARLESFKFDNADSMKPKLPDFIKDLAVNNKDLALKLVPFYVRQTVENLASNFRLIDID